MVNDGIHDLLKELPSEARLRIVEKDGTLLKPCALTFLSLVETGKLKNLPEMTVTDIVALLAVIAQRILQLSSEKPVPRFGIEIHRLRKAFGSDRAFLFFMAFKRLAQGQVSFHPLKLQRPIKDFAQLNRAVWRFLVQHVNGEKTSKNAERHLLTADILYLLLAADETEFAQIVLLEESPLTGNIRSGLIRTKVLLNRLQRLDKSWARSLTQEHLIQALTASRSITQACLVTDPTQGPWVTRTLANVCALEMNAKLLQRLLIAKAGDTRLFGKSFGFQTFEALYRVENFRESPSHCILLPVFDVFVALPLMPHPVVTMIREALVAIESQVRVNPSLASFYWIRDCALRDLTPQRALAIFIPQELLPMPEVFWTRRLIDAGVLVDSGPFVNNKSVTAVAMGQTIDAQMHSLSGKERKTKMRSQRLDEETVSWPSVRPDTQTFVHGFVFRLSHATSCCDETVATLMHQRQQACEFRAIQVAGDLENRAETFLNPVAVKSILKNYDTDFMHFAQGVSLAELIQRNPQVKLKLEMMDYHRQKKRKTQDSEATPQGERYEFS